MILDFTITTATIVTIISVSSSTGITLWLTNNNKKKNLDDQFDALLKIAIQYPYLENDTFTASWIPNFNLDDEKFLRYDVYCNLLFNFLHRVATHYRYDKKKINNYISVKHWIRTHKQVWTNPVVEFENIDSYDKKYVDFINSYLS